MKFIIPVFPMRRLILQRLIITQGLSFFLSILISDASLCIGAIPTSPESPIKPENHGGNSGLLPHPHSPPVDSRFSGFCLGRVPGRLGCFWCLLTCTHPLPTATSFCNSVQRVRLAGTLLTPVLSGLQRQDPSP